MATNEEDVPEGSGAQEAVQLAQQAAQSARQATQQAEQAVQAAQQAARGVGAETSGATIETEISPASIAKAWAANVKRAYDEYQDVGLVSARRSQQNFDSINAVSLQALQNAVTTADMVAKAAVKHSEFATDRIWAGTDVSQGAQEGAILRGLARLAAGAPDDVVG
jgi:hypothetical protein